MAKFRVKMRCLKGNFTRRDVRMSCSTWSNGLWFCILGCLIFTRETFDQLKFLDLTKKRPIELKTSITGIGKLVLVVPQSRVEHLRHFSAIDEKEAFQLVKQNWGQIFISRQIDSDPIQIRKEWSTDDDQSVHKGIATRTPGKANAGDNTEEPNNRPEQPKVSA